MTDEERALFEVVLGGAKPSDPVDAISDESEPTGPAKAMPERLRPSGVDGRTAERLRKGAIEPDAKIDLHGFTEDTAHRALAAFLPGAAASGARLILVITGKGLKPAAAADERFDLELGRRTRGVLKAMVPRWLQEPELVRFVADARTAHRKHGGSGAIYVYLRKERKPV